MRLKFLGHETQGKKWRTRHWHVSKGRITPELSDDEAQVLLDDFPDAFELVAETRNVEKPEHNRMRKAPTKRRAKT